MEDKIPHRLDDVDYYGRRIFHVTMVTESRRAILGRVEGDPAIPAGQEGAPHTTATELGREVINCLRAIPQYHKEARLIAHQLMPDHLHFILFITKDGGDHLGNIIKGFKIGCNKAYRRLFPAAAPSVGEPAVPSFVGEPAILSQAQQPTQVQQPTQAQKPPQAQSPRRPTTEERKHGILWQASYYEKPLSGKGQLERMIDYVHDNPRRLLVKRLNSRLFRISSLTAAGITFSAVGEPAILSQAQKRSVAVRISRHNDAARLARIIDEQMQKARNGAVIISPFVSPGEKTLQTLLMAEHLKHIRIDGIGFGQYYKPPGEEVDAVADGFLLLLSPWEYDPSRHLGKPEFEELNRIASQIATEE